MANYYKIADLIVRMDSFGRIVKQAEPYLIDGEFEPDIIVGSRREIIKEKQPHLSDDECEYLSTGENFYFQLLEHDGMMLHASAVVLDGKAYLFSAPCGTGKSTHTQIWQRVFGDRAVILNDDKPALRWENGQYYAYGTPWSGKYNLNVNMKVPVAGICFLSQGKENKIEPYGGREAMFDILSQTTRPMNAALRVGLLSQLDRLVKNVPIWKMACNMEDEAAIVSHSAMSAAERK